MLVSHQHTSNAEWRVNLITLRIQSGKPSTLHVQLEVHSLHFQWRMDFILGLKSASQHTAL